MNAKRKKIEEEVYKVMELLDRSGYNKEKYKTLFKSMDDKKFEKWLKKFFDDDDMNFRFEVSPFGKTKVDLDIEDIKKAADYLKVPLDDYIYLPFINGDTENPIRSRTRCPVGPISTRRLEQILSKKNSYTTEISERSGKTGQVTGHDKSGRVSDMENYSMLIIGAEKGLQEFMSARSDDMYMKQEMLKDISRDGYCSLKNMHSDIGNKTALNTLDVYYTGASMVTDLITPGLIFKRNLENKETKDMLKEKYV